MSIENVFDIIYWKYYKLFFFIEIIMSLFSLIMDSLINSIQEISGMKLV